MHIHLLPKTAAVRAITIDGGGIRGVIPLQQLQEMQTLLGPEFPLTSLSDVVFGTSIGKDRFSFLFALRYSLVIGQDSSCGGTGGFAALDAFALERPPAECLQDCRTLLLRFFGEQQKHPLLSSPRRIVRGALGLGMYNAEKLESLLQEHYSATLPLFDARVSGRTKVATTTVVDDETVLLATYKPAVLRPDNAGM
jgi:hypothetical protein